VEIRRFGIGYRRAEGPAGTRGVDGQPIHSDARGVIAELAFRPHAAIAPHDNPNLTYFVVIEGGGFVQVGDERARIAAGEAAVWPPHVIHAAWTETTPMRAIVVEFALEPGMLLLDGGAIEVPLEGERAEAAPAAPAKTDGEPR
jgi:quercetin dioxygenase-like cupin family protein